MSGPAVAADATERRSSRDVSTPADRSVALGRLGGIAVIGGRSRHTQLLGYVY